MFDRVVAERPEYLTLPGPGAGTSDYQWSAEVLLSILGFSMWPQVFMKCFTARSARLVQHSAVVYPTFLLFLVPLFFLGYAALLLPGAPTDERVLLWLVGHPLLGERDAHDGRCSASRCSPRRCRPATRCCTVARRSWCATC
jgi:SSS family solute:Na+ symporter